MYKDLFLFIWSYLWGLLLIDERKVFPCFNF